MRAVTAPVRLRWQQDWADFRAVLETHLSALPFRSVGEVDSDDLATFRLSHGLTEDTDLEEWFLTLDSAIPADTQLFEDAPNLWPDKLPAPPALPNDLGEQLRPHLVSRDEVAQAYARLTLFMLAHADTVREFARRQRLN